MSISSGECALALDAGGTAIKGALALAGQTLLDLFETPIPQAGSAQELLGAFREAGERGAALAAQRGLALKGVGVCIPGPFDYAQGISLMTHKYQAIRGIPLAPSIASGKEHLPVRFMHDSSAFLLGELALRPRLGKDVCSVIIGTGLGFACIKNGRLHQNESGGPGISIFRLPHRGETAEDFVSKRGIARAYAALGGSGAQSVKEIAALAHRGDGAALAAFSQTGQALAQILAPILRENGFDCMILGGQIAKTGAPLIRPIQETLDALRVPCRVEAALRIDEAPLLGAAQLI